MNKCIIFVLSKAGNTNRDYSPINSTEMKDQAIKTQFDTPFGVVKVSSQLVDQVKSESVAGANVFKFKFTVSTEAGRTSFDFFGSVNDWNKNKRSTDAKFAVYCFLSDALAGENSFEDFCSEFGYDTDSRKAEKIYKACEKSAEKAKRIFSDLYQAIEFFQED